MPNEVLGNAGRQRQCVAAEGSHDGCQEFGQWAWGSGFPQRADAVTAASVVQPAHLAERKVALQDRFATLEGLVRMLS